MATAPGLSFRTKFLACVYVKWEVVLALWSVSHLALARALFQVSKVVKEELFFIKQLEQFALENVYMYGQMPTNYRSCLGPQWHVLCCGKREREGEREREGGKERGERKRAREKGKVLSHVLDLYLYSTKCPCFFRIPQIVV